MTDQTELRTAATTGQPVPENSTHSPQQPWMSLILATYGRDTELSVVLDSLVAQTDNGFEVIVVDQNPDDRLQDVLSGFPTLSIQHVRQDEPNLSLARNRGLQAARGDWVAFPDDDCWYEADCLARVGQTLAEIPALDGVVASWVEVEGKSPRAPHELALRAWRDFRGGDASSITLFLRRDAVNQQGGFDTQIGVGQFFGAGEETDLVLRLLSQNHRLQFLPDAKVHHHFSHSVPALSTASWQAALKRARGVGAIYAKHKLSSWVVLRGLVAPLINPLRSDKPVAGLAFGLAEVTGRFQGMLRWRGRSKDHSPQ